MIREFQIRSPDSDEDKTDELSSGTLRVRLVDDDAHLTWEAAEACWSFRVPARSLLLALRAAWDDDHPVAADIGRPRQARVRPPGPANSHQPWTPEQDAQLRDTWLAAVPPAAARIGELAGAMGRSRNAIRSRLARIGCDPDVPGRLLEQATVVPVQEQDGRSPTRRTGVDDRHREFQGVEVNQ